MPEIKIPSEKDPAFRISFCESTAIGIEKGDVAGAKLFWGIPIGKSIQIGSSLNVRYAPSASGLRLELNLMEIRGN